MSIELSEIVKPAPTKLERPIRIATFGDSTSNYLSADSNTDQEILNMQFPVSGVNNYVISYEKVSSISSVIHRMVANGGVNGNTTQMAIDRSKSISATTRRAMIDIISKKPDIVLLRCGSVNDVMTFNTETSDSVVNSVISRHCAIVKTFTSSGIFVIDSGVLGFDGNGGYTEQDLDACRTRLQQMNAYYKNASSNDDKWVFVDTSGTLSVNGAFIAGVSYDGTHLSSVGNKILGMQEYNEIKKLFTGKSITGSVVYDGQLDFQNGTSTSPANHSVSTYLCAISDARCDVGGYRCTVTTTGANATVKVSGLRNNFSNIVLGDNLVRSQTVFVTNEYGDVVDYLVVCRCADLYYTGNTKRVVAEYSYGTRNGETRLECVFNAVDSYANLGDCSNFIQITFPVAGVYNVVIMPELVSKYVAID